MVDVGDDGDVAQIHVASSNVGQWLERDLAGKPGPTFPDRAQNLEIRGRVAPKKEARPKDRAHLTRCGAIYSEIAKKQWLWSGFHRPAKDLFERGYRNRAGFAGYCRRAGEFEILRV
jgi:hypothetical protein